MPTNLGGTSLHCGHDGGHLVCNSALPKGHPQQHVENLDRANFIRSACPGMDLNKSVMQLA